MSVAEGYQGEGEGEGEGSSRAAWSPGPVALDLAADVGHVRVPRRLALHVLRARCAQCVIVWAVRAGCGGRREDGRGATFWPWLSRYRAGRLSSRSLASGSRTASASRRAWAREYSAQCPVLQPGT